MQSMDRVRIALLQGQAEPSVAAALAWTEARLEEAAAAGARIVCTQELFATPYFCRVQDPAFFDLAEPVPGPTTERLARKARELGVVLIVSLFERRAPGVYHNTAAVIDADGTYLGKYRKMHIPQDPGFEEKYYFTPGDLGFRAWSTRYGRIGVLICWDQWYPEAARLTALHGAQIIFCPTAIGWLSAEKARLGARQRAAWLNVQMGHAVANGCYFAAVNRVGHEGQIEFWGTSFVADVYGERIAEGSVCSPEIVYADCAGQAVEERRRTWPFFRDRRIDSYDGILKRFLDE
jgi:N-carbamoylputrescine amidase